MPVISSARMSCLCKDMTTGKPLVPGTKLFMTSDLDFSPRGAWTQSIKWHRPVYHDNYLDSGSHYSHTAQEEENNPVTKPCSVHKVNITGKQGTKPKNKTDSKSRALLSLSFPYFLSKIIFVTWVQHLFHVLSWLNGNPRFKYGNKPQSKYIKMVLL